MANDMRNTSIKRETPPPGAVAEQRWASDVIVDLMHRYALPYAALNPGASYRGLHDSMVNYGQNTPYMIRHPATQNGGGFEYPSKDPSGRTTSSALTFGEQDEAAIHEHAHAWYDHKVNEKGFDGAYQVEYRNAVKKLSEDPDADPGMRNIATFFMKNDPKNTTEMYASLASGSMSDLSKFPPYLRPYYADLFAPKPRVVEAPVNA